jgi:ribonuclease Z
MPEQPTKTRIPRIALGLLILLVALAVGAVLFSSTVQQRIFDLGARKLVAAANTAPLADDALRVGICGSSAPLPSTRRAKACVAVFAGGKIYVVDTGPESTENLMLWGIPLNRIGAVLLTHFHSDHIGDLGELQLQSWAAGRPQPLLVYGGPGIERVVSGFNEAYRQDQVYRTEHQGEPIMPSRAWGLVARPVAMPGAPSPALDRSAVVLDDGKLKITAMEVNHEPIRPAFAYRFDYKGRSAVVTGDLKHHPPLIRGAANADLLISEAISRNMTRSLENASRASGRRNTARIMRDIQDYHISPEEAADIANRANVRLLALYHLAPAPDGYLLRRLFANGLDDARRGEWTIVEDGDLFTLPIGSKEIVAGRVAD